MHLTHPAKCYFFTSIETCSRDDTENRARLFLDPTAAVSPFHFKTFTNYVLAFQWKWIPSPVTPIALLSPSTLRCRHSSLMHSAQREIHSISLRNAARFSRAPLFVTGREGEIDSQIGGMRFKALIQTALVDESLVDINNFWNFVLRKGVGGTHFCEFLWTSYAFHEALNSPRLNERTINNPRSMG